MTLDEAQRRLIDEVRASRRRTLSDEPSPSLHQAREALVAVWPLLPSMIDEKIGTADARIFSREDLRGLLADFAVDVLIEQARTIERWIDSKARQRRRRKKA